MIIAFLAIAAWAFVAMLVGLVMGVPELRTFGAAGFIGFGLLAYLVDRFTPQHKSWADHLVDDDYARIYWDEWPDYRKDSAA